MIDKKGHTHQTQNDGGSDGISLKKEDSFGIDEFTPVPEVNKKEWQYAKNEQQ
jgi:hypothetical protein